MEHDLQSPQNQEKKHGQQDDASQETPLLGKNGEDKIGLLLGKKFELGLGPF